MTKTCNFIIQAGLIFLIIFTPLAFGAVPVWAYTLMELVVLLMLTAWLLKMITQDTNGRDRVYPCPQYRNAGQPQGLSLQQ